MHESAFQCLQPTEYLKRFLEYNIRPDGRQFNELRDVKIRKGVLKTACIGSALVAAGHSRFVAGVTAEIGPPQTATPTCGKVLINVEFPKSCGADLDALSGLPSQTSIELTQLLSNNEIIDLSQFCIKEGTAVWMIYVNVICLEFDGNAIDWSLQAALSALEDSKLPSLEWCRKGSWWRICLENRETEDNSGLKLNGRQIQLGSRPFSITVANILDKYWIIDPTVKEDMVGSTITLWRTSKESPLNIIRHGGSPLNLSTQVQSLYPLFENAFISMEIAIMKPQESLAENGNDVWEVSLNDFEDSSEEDELSK